jgi:arylsulfatase A-like enzyme
MRHPTFLIVLALSLAYLGKVAPSLVAAERPNFIFIYTDDQRWDALGCVQREQGEQARFPWLKSPNLDRLASEGIRFRNAFVVTALCAPSRAAFLTGRYGHLNGIIDNHSPFNEKSVTHASLMRAAGYQTAYVGKWHMGSQNGQRPGFDFSASFIGQGIYFDCPIEVNGVKTESKGWVDDVSTDYAIDFITKSKDKPFSLVLGYKTCHGPFTPPPRTESLYTDAEGRAVPNLNKTAIYRQNAATQNPTKPSAAPGQPVKTNIGMFRGLHAIDENVGRLLATLDQLGLTENTVVVYSSDNGYYLGEHGLGDKRSAYEESIRVPMLIRYPKLIKPNRTIDEMVLNIDLAPTWLELAGLPVPAEMQGRSWKPLLSETQSDKPWRSSFLYNYFLERGFQVPTIAAVRTTSAKLVKYPGHEEWTEMFDLQKDPYEINNIYNDPNHLELRKKLEAEYEQQVAATGYRIPDFADEKKPAAPVVSSGPREFINGVVLQYRFTKDEGQRTLDESPFKNHGRIVGTKLSAGQQGKAARQFDGKGHIEVPVSSSLDPSRTPFSITASVKAEADGVILARGGQSLGYALYIADGKPTFAYRTLSGITTIASPKTCIGEWSTVKARVSDKKTLILEVNEEQVAEAPLKDLIPRNPNDGLQIGADLGSFVLGEERPNFRGAIESISMQMGKE